MTTPEGAVKDELKRFLEMLGAYYYCPVPMGYGRKGVPDFLICHKGHFIAVETKAPGKEKDVTPWQQKELEAIYHAGGMAYTISDVNYIKKILYAL